MVEEIKNLYVGLSANTNNGLFQISNCIELIIHYTEKEPNVDEVLKYSKELKEALEYIGNNHQQEYHAMCMFVNYLLAQGVTE